MATFASLALFGTTEWLTVGVTLENVLGPAILDVGGSVTFAVQHSAATSILARIAHREGDDTGVDRDPDLDVHGQVLLGDPLRLEVSL